MLKLSSSTKNAGTCPSINSNQKTLFCLVRELFQGRLLLLLRNSIVSCSFYVATAKLPAVTSKREWNGTCRKKKESTDLIQQSWGRRVWGEGEREFQIAHFFHPHARLSNNASLEPFVLFKRPVWVVCVCVRERQT